MWVERDGAGPARIYLGEPAEPMPAGGDPEFANLKTPRIVAPAAAALVRKAGFLDGAAARGRRACPGRRRVRAMGVIRRREGIIYYARAGRADPRTKLPFEIAPATANGTRFVLTREGKPVAGAKVTLISPTRVSTELVTDGAGAITPPLVEKGRYLLSAAAKDMTEHSLPRGPVTTLQPDHDD
ncbi:DUF4198 domain-containing protein [Sphingomonas aerolata]|uniref:DUF4198 domain-containing protein n=1 Tax=Sphingomonas aerolata TaxID=185951 RepID=UPI002FE22706